jgi:hypothetical protein
MSPTRTILLVSGSWTSKCGLKRTDGSNVTFTRMLVPWQYVLSVGILEESGRLPAGFADATVLSLKPEDE